MTAVSPDIATLEPKKSEIDPSDGMIFERPSLLNIKEIVSELSFSPSETVNSIVTNPFASSSGVIVAVLLAPVPANTILESLTIF